MSLPIQGKPFQREADTDQSGPESVAHARVQLRHIAAASARSSSCTISNTKNITGFIAGTATWNVKNSSLPHPLIMHMQKTTGQPE
jgi:hypothetical protein